jgi:hypothetical protein
MGPSFEQGSFISHEKADNNAESDRTAPSKTYAYELGIIKFVSMVEYLQRSSSIHRRETLWSKLCL